MASVLQYQLEIDAPPEAVWSVLADFPSYAQWNEFSPHVDCDGRVGHSATVYARLDPGGKLIRNNLTLFTFDAPISLCWGYQHWYMQVDRCQRLSPLPGERTLYANAETFSGLLARPVVGILREKLLRGYEIAARGLKRRVESFKGENI